MGDRERCGVYLQKGYDTLEVFSSHHVNVYLYLVHFRQGGLEVRLSNDVNLQHPSELCVALGITIA